MIIHLRKAIICSTTFLCFAGYSFGEENHPKEVPSSSIIGEAKEVRESTILIGLSNEFVVDGDVSYDGYFLGADKLRFKPGSRLVFSSRALMLRNNLIVAARTIINEDQAKPGIITWDRGTRPATTTPQSGQAQSGSHAIQDGQSGGPGSNGAQGNDGIPGESAPNLTLFMVSAEGAPPVIDLSGQQGGTGGTGQQGGNGGVGHQGSPASAALFDCRRGPGRGGNGGSGGNGGLGGQGGAGGKGGTFTLVSLPSAFPALLTLVRGNVSGGSGGDGGEGGAKGEGGPGGAQGAKALPQCTDVPERHGAKGGDGQLGVRGSQGLDGIQGDVAYTTLTQDAFNQLFGVH